MSVTIHRGSYTTIPPGTSPGLQFLKEFMPALDSLEASSNPIASFLHPDAQVFVGSNPPNSGRQAIPLLNVRRKHLQELYHVIEVAWDIMVPGSVQEEESGPEQKPGAKRTVMFEATSSTTFRSDPDQFAVKMKEFNILELEYMSGEWVSQEPGRGPGWQVVEMRTYMDPRPVQDRAARLHSVSAYGDSKTTS